MSGLDVAWLVVGWILGVLTTTGALFVWSLIMPAAVPGGDAP